MSTAPPTTENEPLIEMGQSVAEDVMRLVRAEIDLAKAQMAATVKRMAVGAALLAATAVTLVLMLIFGFAVLPEKFGPDLLGSSWMGWGIMALFFLVCAVILGIFGFRQFRHSLKVTQEAVESMKEDFAWLTQLSKRSVSGK